MPAPSAWPMVRMNSTEEVAMPRSLQPTLACTETRNVVLQNPIPMPISVPAQFTRVMVEPSSSASSSTLPAIKASAPTAPVSR